MPIDSTTRGVPRPISGLLVAAVAAALGVSASACKAADDRRGSLHELETSPAREPGTHPRTPATEREIDEYGAGRPLAPPAP